MKYSIQPPKVASESGYLRATAQRVCHIGGISMGYFYTSFHIAAESIHQNVGFSGYPIGGIDMESALFGTVEELCKAQALDNAETGHQ
ncbi:hypothetical protein [Nocardia suismassiliense]|uniref:hypothetical protein n=1 Tax=Nocardia suismassiliense TaxID=2077092 RepID=UPI00131EF3F9|nr:hypothetical protein [Nocardia suismassiliense]